VTWRRLFGAASLRSDNRYMLPTPPHSGAASLRTDDARTTLERLPSLDIAAGG
jgi:hypothetical protein